MEPASNASALSLDAATGERMRRILVIDDEASLRRAVRTVLERVPALLFEAEDGETGMALALSERPDLVICDLHLGGTSGWEVLARIRGNRATAVTPVILITGADDATAMRQGMDSGADDFLKKPFSASELMAAVKARLRHQDQVRLQGERTQEQLRQLLEATGDFVAVISPHTLEVSYLNHAARRATRCRTDSATGPLHLADLYPPSAYAELVGRALPSAIETGRWRGQTEFGNHDGAVLPVDQEILVHRTPDGTLEWLSLIARDITDRQRADSELRKLSQAVDQSPVSVVITDTAGRIEYVNPKFCDVTGYTAQEVLGQNPRVLKSGATTPDAYHALWQAIVQGHEWRGEFHNRKKTGERYWEAAVISPIKDRAGKITHFLAVKEDITARKQAKLERDEMEVELRHAQKLESIGHLAAGIAHEINTPAQYVGDSLHFLEEAFEDFRRVLAAYRRSLETLTASSGDAGVAQEIADLHDAVDLAYLEANVPPSLQRCIDGVARVSDIVRAMKEFAHPDQREKTAADINHALANTLAITRNEYKYVADVETDFGMLPLVLCHPGDLNQVFLNLIVNAAHAIGDAVAGTGTRGRIRVVTRADASTVCIDIGDSGTGIPGDIQHRVFDPFFTTKPVGKGSGQGLAIARSIVVDKHHGALTFTSTPGCGTTFSIVLPIDDAPRASDESAA